MLHGRRAAECGNYAEGLEGRVGRMEAWSQMGEAGSRADQSWLFTRQAGRGWRLNGQRGESTPCKIGFIRVKNTSGPQNP